MSLLREEVIKIAELARLGLTEVELDHYGRQLSAVLEYAARLNELDLEGVEPSAHAIDRTNVMREDIVVPSLPTEAALPNAAAASENQFLIQSVLDE